MIRSHLATKVHNFPTKATLSCHICNIGQVIYNFIFVAEESSYDSDLLQVCDIEPSFGVFVKKFFQVSLGSKFALILNDGVVIEALVVMNAGLAAKTIAPAPAVQIQKMRTTLIGCVAGV